MTLDNNFFSDAHTNAFTIFLPYVVKVNPWYALFSSSVSFWIPCTIMIFTYLAIFKEANRQEKQIHSRLGNPALLAHGRDCNGEALSSRWVWEKCNLGILCKKGKRILTRPYKWWSGEEWWSKKTYQETGLSHVKHRRRFYCLSFQALSFLRIRH